MGSMPEETSHYDFEAVTGFFMQDDPATDASTFDYASIYPRQFHHIHMS